MDKLDLILLREFTPTTFKLVAQEATAPFEMSISHNGEQVWDETRMSFCIIAQIAQMGQKVYFNSIAMRLL